MYTISITGMAEIDRKQLWLSESQVGIHINKGIESGGNRH